MQAQQKKMRIRSEETKTEGTRMMRKIENDMNVRPEITVSEGSAMWTQILRDAEAKQDEAIRKFHDWFCGLMDPAEERTYTDAVMMTIKGMTAGERN